MEEMAEKPNLLKDLGETAIFLRDGVIGILALAYGLGLVVWSIYAANAGIVLSQVVDLQYFVAGIIPALVLGATYIILKRRVSPKKQMAPLGSCRFCGARVGVCGIGHP